MARKVRRRRLKPNGKFTRGNPTPELGGHARAKVIREGKYQLCGAERRNGEPCKQLAGAGTTHLGSGPCKFHGGSTPNHERSAGLEIAERQVAELAPEVPDDELNTSQAMREVLRASMSRLRGWQVYIARLDPEALTTQVGQYIVQAERKERLANGRIAAYAHQMGLSELEIRLVSGQVDMVKDAVEAAMLEAFDEYMTDGQRQLLAATLRKQFRVAAGEDDPDELAMLDADIRAAREALGSEPIDAEVVE